MSPYPINEMTVRWHRNWRDEIVIKEDLSLGWFLGNLTIGFCAGYGLLLAATYFL